MAFTYDTISYNSKILKSSIFRKKLNFLDLYMDNKDFHTKILDTTLPALDLCHWKSYSRVNSSSLTHEGLPQKLLEGV